MHAGIFKDPHFASTCPHLLHTPQKESGPAFTNFSCSFAYFYCQYNNEATKTPSNIIRTLLAQLLCDLDYTILEDTVKHLFSKITQGHGPPTDVKQLTELVAQVGRLYRRSIVVIDGLDECPIELRRNLLDLVIMLASGNSTNILVVSRKVVDIEDELKDFPTISLEHEQVNLKEDMRKLITEEFKDTKKWGHRFQIMKDEITESLILGSGRNM